MSSIPSLLLFALFALTLVKYSNSYGYKYESNPWTKECRLQLNLPGYGERRYGSPYLKPQSQKSKQNTFQSSNSYRQPSRNHPIRPSIPVNRPPPTIKYEQNREILRPLPAPPTRAPTYRPNNFVSENTKIRPPPPPRRVSNNAVVTTQQNFRQPQAPRPISANSEQGLSSSSFSSGYQGNNNRQRPSPSGGNRQVSTNYVNTNTNNRLIPDRRPIGNSGGNRQVTSTFVSNDRLPVENLGGNRQVSTFVSNDNRLIPERRPVKTFETNRPVSNTFVTNDRFSSERLPVGNSGNRQVSNTYVTNDRIIPDRPPIPISNGNRQVSNTFVTNNRFTPDSRPIENLGGNRQVTSTFVADDRAPIQNVVRNRPASNSFVTNTRLISDNRPIQNLGGNRHFSNSNNFVTNEFIDAPDRLNTKAGTRATNSNNYGTRFVDDYDRPNTNFQGDDRVLVTRTRTKPTSLNRFADDEITNRFIDELDKLT